MPNVDLRRCVASDSGYYDRSERFDAVQVAHDNEADKTYARMQTIFEWHDRATRKEHFLVLLLNFQTVLIEESFHCEHRVRARVRVPSGHHLDDIRSYNLVNINTIDFRVCLKRDFADKSGLDAYYVLTQ